MNVSFDDYVQPFPTFLIELPDGYRQWLTECFRVKCPALVLTHHDASSKYIISWVMSGAEEHSTEYILTPRFGTIEEALRSGEGSGNDFAQAEVIQRVALNFGLLMTHFGVRNLGPVDPESHVRNMRNARRKNQAKAERARRLLDAEIDLIAFEQDVVVPTGKRRTNRTLIVTALRRPPLAARSLPASALRTRPIVPKADLRQTDPRQRPPVSRRRCGHGVSPSTCDSTSSRQRRRIRMPSELATALTALADRLAQLATHVQGLHEELKVLALRLVSVADNRESPSVNNEIEKQPTGMSQVVEEAPSDGEKANNILPLLTLGSASPAVADGLPKRVRHRTGTTTDEELGAIETRSRLKAEAMRWAATRRQLIIDGANFREQIAPGDRDLLRRASELPECYLWMCKPSFRAPEDLTLLEDGARCFDLVADALAIVRTVVGDSKLEKEFLRLSMEVLAQSQSALRVAVGRICDRADADQARVYEWLTSTANRRQMFLERYMRLDDPADPRNLDEIKAVLASTKDNIAGRQETDARKRACLSKLRYHAKRVDESGGNETDWNSVIEAVEECFVKVSRQVMWRSEDRCSRSLTNRLMVATCPKATAWYCGRSNGS